MRFLLLLLLLLVLHPATEAAVGLVTVPERQGVRLTIYNGVDLTLVQETRTLVLRQGRNRIQYQWAGTLIDTTSLELRPLERQDDIEIIDVFERPDIASMASVLVTPALVRRSDPRTRILGDLSSRQQLSDFLL